MKCRDTGVFTSSDADVERERRLYSHPAQSRELLLSRFTTFMPSSGCMSSSMAAGFLTRGLPNLSIADMLG